MKRFIASLVACLFFMVATSAHAQSRTWVSGVGDDLNPCSRTAPCKTFAGAISKTAAGGEINCLDPGGFGAVTIAKSITIDCTGTLGSILASNTNGVLVNAANIIVTLRGITINGANTTTGNGVRILNAAAVNLDNVVIQNFAGTTTNGRGVAIETSAANVRVTIQNSHFYNLNFVGIHSNPTGGNVILAIDNTQLSRGGSTHIDLRQLTTATINNTSATNSPTGAGLTLELSNAAATVAGSDFSNNAFGILVGNGGSPTARVGSTLISGNTSAGLQITSGLIISSGNNIIRGNVGNEAPSSNAGTQ
jgi:hypothetical protein